MNRGKLSLSGQWRILTDERTRKVYGGPCRSWSKNEGPWLSTGVGVSLSAQREKRKSKVVAWRKWQRAKCDAKSFLGLGVEASSPRLEFCESLQPLPRVRRATIISDNHTSLITNRQNGSRRWSQVRPLHRSFLTSNLRDREGPHRSPIPLQHADADTVKTELVLDTPSRATSRRRQDSLDQFSGLKNTPTNTSQGLHRPLHLP